MARRRPFQKLFGRTPQIKILDYLASRRDPATAAEVQRKIKTHYIYTLKLVQSLERAGLVKAEKEGRRFRLSLNRAHPMARRVLR